MFRNSVTSMLLSNMTKFAKCVNTPCCLEPFINSHVEKGSIQIVFAQRSKKRMKPAAKRQLERVQAQLKSSSGNQAELQSEFDEIIAGDCPSCGEMIIETVDEPFIPQEDYEKFLQSWSLLQ
eukprot:m.179806 g.179806  ORF g.179806 m.179806 type:complete len:122 (-) comp15481_c0_seq10:70-435(-)